MTMAAVVVLQLADSSIPPPREHCRTISSEPARNVAFRSQKHRVRMFLAHDRFDWGLSEEEPGICWMFTYICSTSESLGLFIFQQTWFQVVDFVWSNKAKYFMRKGISWNDLFVLDVESLLPTIWTHVENILLQTIVGHVHVPGVWVTFVFEWIYAPWPMRHSYVLVAR